MWTHEQLKTREDKKQIRMIKLDSGPVDSQEADAALDESS